MAAVTVSFGILAIGKDVQTGKQPIRENSVTSVMRKKKRVSAGRL
jgi:hypothetical protein